MGISSRVFNVRRLVAGLAVAALAITGQNLIAISASATEADSANSAVDYAGVFDGTNTNNVYAASADPIPATAASTVEAWIYPTAATNDTHDRLVLSQGNNATGNFYIKRKNGILSVFRNGAAGDLNCGPVPSNAWTHVAFTMSGTTVNCYINGGWAYTGSLTNGAVGAGLAVGAWAQNLTDTNTYWQGQVDQIKVWNGVLSEAQVAQSMHAYAATGVTSAPSLLAHYDFNEGTNTDAKVYNRAGTGLDLDASVLTYSDVKTVVTGGNIDSYRTQVYKFPRTYLTAQGGWTVPSNFNSIEALTVGGGGGGGENVGNAGSGGSVAYHSGFGLTAGGTLAVKVGQGGRAGVYVDDSMVGTTATTWQTNLAGTVNTTIASAYRDGGDGQSSSLSVGATTLTAPGGRGGATYWDSNECSAGTAVHTAANTPSGAVGSGGTTNAAGAAGAQGINGNTAGTAGIASTNTFTIAGAAYKFGAGGAGAAGTTPTTSGAGGADGGGASAASTNLSVSAPRGGDGAVNSGSGGAGGITACTPGGFGGSGVVYIRTIGPKVTAITGGAGSAQSIVGSVSGPNGNFSLTVSSTVGTLNIASTALTASGASKVAGSGTDKFITYQGTIAQLNAALNATKLTLQGTPVLGAINLELNPIVSPSGNIYYNSTNGHYYQLVTTTASWASAKSAAEGVGNALYGLTGYLTNVTAESEKDFIFNNIATGTLWSGGYYNGTNWIWEGGPEAGTVFWSGIATGSAVAGQ